MATDPKKGQPRTLGRSSPSSSSASSSSSSHLGFTAGVVANDLRPLADSIPPRARRMRITRARPSCAISSISCRASERSLKPSATCARVRTNASAKTPREIERARNEEDARDQEREESDPAYADEHVGQYQRAPLRGARASQGESKDYLEDEPNSADCSRKRCLFNGLSHRGSSCDAFNVWFLIDAVGWLKSRAG